MMSSPHPWHRVVLSNAERHDMDALEEQLNERYRSVISESHISAMVRGTAGLLRSSGVCGHRLYDHVRAACRAALDAEVRDTLHMTRALAFIANLEADDPISSVTDVGEAIAVSSERITNSTPGAI